MPSSRMPWAALLALALVTVVPAARLTVRDIDGRAWQPLAPAPGAIHVPVFVASDCPVSNHYAPEIDRIAAEVPARSVQFFLVYAEPRITPTAVRAHVRDFHPRLDAPAIIDTGFALTSAAGATVTPEVAVLTSAGRAYRGRIDDLYVAAGQMRSAARQHDLRDAIAAVLNGRPVVPATTPPVGCFIERPPS